MPILVNSNASGELETANRNSSLSILTEREHVCNMIVIGDFEIMDFALNCPDELANLEQILEDMIK